MADILIVINRTWVDRAAKPGWNEMDVQAGACD